MLQNVEMEKYTKRMQEIKESPLSKDLKSWLDEKLKYSYEPSLRNRLREIFDSMPRRVQNFIGEKKNFVQNITEIRNELTHHSKGHRYDLIELVNHVRCMKTILKVLYFKLIGIQDSEIERILNTNSGIIEERIK